MAPASAIRLTGGPGQKDRGLGTSSPTLPQRRGKGVRSGRRASRPRTRTSSSGGSPRRQSGRDKAACGKAGRGCLPANIRRSGIGKPPEHNKRDSPSFRGSGTFPFVGLKHRFKKLRQSGGNNGLRRVPLQPGIFQTTRDEAPRSRIIERRQLVDGLILNPRIRAGQPSCYDGGIGQQPERAVARFGGVEDLPPPGGGFHHGQATKENAQSVIQPKFPSTEVQMCKQWPS